MIRGGPVNRSPNAFATSGGKLTTLARALVHTPGFAIRTRP